MGMKLKTKGSEIIVVSNVDRRQCDRVGSLVRSFSSTKLNGSQYSGQILRKSKANKFTNSTAVVKNEKPDFWLSKFSMLQLHLPLYCNRFNVR